MGKSAADREREAKIAERPSFFFLANFMHTDASTYRVAFAL